ncbi:nicotinamidase-related amidase [Saccharothrix coeruleofusca]|uniref:cysteine hydrolase family protein n=1 Tax=Saccharothrix coeruleofusca TaxID=33919 RepID=UPI0027DDFD53|nr:isochorismatase family cysteine hydrolase [Saccharothrix coeruleofusca]MBP2336871.1 nicotinamidase-related amidase [Saccharothrix coeruleofusca]
MTENSRGTGTALIVGDVQRGITEGYPFARTVVGPIAALLPRARAAGVLVVFVRIAWRLNGADVAEGNPVITALFQDPSFLEGSPGTEVDPALEVGPEDVVVLKRRASAFAGTDLDLVLRARGIDSLVLTGVATGAMVTATLFDAADRDYRITVLRDCCADADPAVHDFLVDVLFPSRGVTVTDSASWDLG